MNLIDSHCHLFFDSIKENLSEIINETINDGVSRMITVGTDIPTSKECVEMAGKIENVYASVGIHPHDAGESPENFISILRDLAQNEKVIAIGEMGLDYYRNHSSAEEQKPVFRAQLELAQDLNLPFIFHNREADEDVYQMIKEVGYINGVAHCFSSDAHYAEKFLDLGLYISFAGNLTYKNSILPEVAKNIPNDKLLVETDSPFLSPVPFRGKPNYPGRTRYTAEKLAEIKNIPFSEFAIQLTKNTETLFNLPPMESVS